MSDNSLKISCVICTYRRTDVLEGAIQSVINQTLDPKLYEIIIVDNNSQDNTPDIVKPYTELSSHKVVYILEEKVGLSYARNTGIDNAQSEIIAFIDDDAEADSKWLEALLVAYESSADIWAVGGKILPIWDAERPQWLEDGNLRALSIVDWGDEQRPLSWPERIIGANCSFRKKVFTEVGEFAINLGRKGSLLIGSEDTEIQQRIHQLDKQIIYEPLAIVHHHVSPERLTKTYFIKRSYGNGRTEALLTFQEHGIVRLINYLVICVIQIIPLIIKLFIKIFLKLVFPQKIGVFLNLNSLVKKYGFSQQALIILLNTKKFKMETIK